MILRICSIDCKSGDKPTQHNDEVWISIACMRNSLRFIVIIINITISRHRWKQYTSPSCGLFICMYVYHLSHLCTMLKKLDGMRCHLAGDIHVIPCNNVLDRSPYPLQEREFWGVRTPSSQWCCLSPNDYNPFYHLCNTHRLTICNTNRGIWQSHTSQGYWHQCTTECKKNDADENWQWQGTASPHHLSWLIQWHHWSCQNVKCGKSYQTNEMWCLEYTAKNLNTYHQIFRNSTIFSSF